MKIYTRKGDDGTTGLWYGGRVTKSSSRPEAYGSVDEAASALGAARAAAEGESMPPKSTYFYPKVPTGLVFNLLE